MLTRQIAADALTWCVLLSAAAVIWAIDKTLGAPPEPPPTLKRRAWFSWEPDRGQA